MTNGRQMADSRHTEPAALRALNLPRTDLTAYTALLHQPGLTSGELAERCALSPARAGRLLGRLVESGMVNRLPGRPARYTAAPPDRALGTVAAERAKELNAARTAIEDLMEVFRETSRFSRPAELIEVVTGADNIIRQIRHAHESARSQIRGFDKPPYLKPTNVGNELIRLAEGLTFRIIYDGEAITVPGRLRNDILPGSRLGEQSRVQCHLPVKMLISDDRMAVIPIGSAPHFIEAAYVVHQSALLDCLIRLFEAEWQHATPVAPTKRPDNIDADTHTLLTLLASGQTETAISRALGWSSRTTQRRVQKLMSELGAVTRFQAGLAAKERGWL